MKTTLARILNQRDLTLLLIGSVIGSGIFLVPGSVLRQVNYSVGLAFTAWLVGGVLALLGALTYAELSARVPAAGGSYIFIRDGFGHLPAFLFGWTAFFVIGAGSVAALSVAFATNLADALKGHLDLAPAAQKAVAVGVIAVLTAINVRGTRQSADMQDVTTLIKVGALVLISGLLFVLSRGAVSAGAAPVQATTNLPIVSAFGMAMIGVYWAYSGWELVACAAGETTTPQRTMPRAFLFGTAAIILLYILANSAYLAALGPGALAESKNAAADSLGAVVGSWAGRLVTLVIMVSVFSAANSTVLAMPRVYYAMARDGLFFQRLAEVHPRFGTPAFAIMAAAPWTAILAISGTFDQLLTYATFATMTFTALAGASLFMYRKRGNEQDIPFRVPGYPWTPLIFILSALAIVVNTLWTQPKESAIGVGLVALGLPVYFYWRSRQTHAVVETYTADPLEVPGE